MAEARLEVKTVNPNTADLIELWDLANSPYDKKVEESARTILKKNPSLMFEIRGNALNGSPFQVALSTGNVGMVNLVVEYMPRIADHEKLSRDQFYREFPTDAGWLLPLKQKYSKFSFASENQYSLAKRAKQAEIEEKQRLSEEKQQLSLESIIIQHTENGRYQEAKGIVDQLKNERLKEHLNKIAIQKMAEFYAKQVTFLNFMNLNPKKRTPFELMNVAPAIQFYNELKIPQYRIRFIEYLLFNMAKFGKSDAVSLLLKDLFDAEIEGLEHKRLIDKASCGYYEGKHWNHLDLMLYQLIRHTRVNYSPGFTLTLTPDSKPYWDICYSIFCQIEKRGFARVLPLVSAEVNVVRKLAPTFFNPTPGAPIPAVPAGTANSMHIPSAQKASAAAGVSLDATPVAAAGDIPDAAPNEGHVASAGAGAGDVPDAAAGAGAGTTRARATELHHAPQQTYRRLSHRRPGL